MLLPSRSPLSDENDTHRDKKKERETEKCDNVITEIKSKAREHHCTKVICYVGKVLY